MDTHERSSVACCARACCLNIALILPHAVKYAVSPLMPREEVCGQARRKARSEENARAHALYPND